MPAGSACSALARFPATLRAICTLSLLGTKCCPPAPARDRTRPPRVPPELLSGNADLLGDVLHRLERNLLGVERKPRYDLEELQQQREPEPCRPGLVAHQSPVLTDQRPRPHQLIRLPLALPPQRTLSITGRTRAGTPLCFAPQVSFRSPGPTARSSPRTENPTRAPRTTPETTTPRKSTSERRSTPASSNWCSWASNDPTTR